MQRRLPILLTALGLILSQPVIADEGRYQAHWNGKSYLILDSDQGHMWTYHGDTIIYNGRIDGDEFESPDKAKIWSQSHGTWKQK
ncbi:MAG: hypothetical protein QNJ56_04850 [Gammaproteobacteria bacterium]|nr:hypothetical protein [Gammaproteobacteria bacterium]